MGPVAAVRILHRRKLAEVDPDNRAQVELELAAEHEKIAGGVEKAVEIGVVDEVVDPAFTRSALARAIAEAPQLRGQPTRIAQQSPVLLASLARPPHTTWCSQRTGAPSPAYRNGSSS